MASHHGEHAHVAHDAAHHAADHAHDAHHGHGSMYRAKQPWVNPLTDPYRGWRFDKFAKRRMWFLGLAWGYGVMFGGWMSYRFFNEFESWTYPVRLSISIMKAFVTRIEPLYTRLEREVGSNGSETFANFFFWPFPPSSRAVHARFPHWQVRLSSYSR